MRHDADLIVRKRSGWVTAIKVILVLAAIGFVAYKVYEKFMKKKQAAELAAAEDGCDAELIADGAETEEDSVFEACAADVIANPESME